MACIDFDSQIHRPIYATVIFLDTRSPRAGLSAVSWGPFRWWQRMGHGYKQQPRSAVEEVYGLLLEEGIRAIY